MPGGRGGHAWRPPVRRGGCASWGVAAGSRRVVGSADVPADPRIEKTDAVRGWIAAVGHYSAIAVPLIVNDVVVGVLTVSGERGRVFGEDDARLAQTFADQAALALANARLYAESAQRRAVADDLRANFQNSGDGAVLAVPMRAKGVIIGALGIVDRVGRVFTDGEAALLQAFADQATLALENARLFSIERSRRQQIAALADIERELAAVLDAERLPALVVERATGLFKASGALWTLDEDRTLIPRAWTGQDLAGERLAPGEGFAGLAIGERRRLNTYHYARSPPAAPP